MCRSPYPLWPRARTDRAPKGPRTTNTCSVFSKASAHHSTSGAFVNRSTRPAIASSSRSPKVVEAEARKKREPKLLYERRVFKRTQSNPATRRAAPSHGPSSALSPRMMINRGSALRISPPPAPPMTTTPTPTASAATATAAQEPGPEPEPAPAAGLPDAIAAALPPDPYDQLEVARKITAVAVAARASRLELEAGRLRQRLAERDRAAAELAERAARLELALRDADARLRAALDENVRTQTHLAAFALPPWFFFWCGLPALLMSDEPVDFVVREGKAGQGAGLARADVQEAGQGPRQGDLHFVGDRINTTVRSTCTVARQTAHALPCLSLPL